MTWVSVPVAQLRRSLMNYHGERILLQTAAWPEENYPDGAVLGVLHSDGQRADVICGRLATEEELHPPKAKE